MPAKLIRGSALALLLLAISMACAQAAARANVRITGDQIVVGAAGGARAVVTRSPFSLQFENAAGQTVLREAPASATPLAVVPVPQIEFGTQTPPPPTLYAPLSFLVGTHAITQTPASQWEGTLGSVTEGGVRYSAQAVVSASQQGNSAVLTLSTNDPTGRQLQVTLSPAGTQDAIALSARPLQPAGVATMSDSFVSPTGEAFHGFGGRHNSLDERGLEFYNWLEQENVSSGSASGLTAPATPGGDTYLFPNGPTAAYYVQSSFISSTGYGFLLARDELSHWRLDSDLPDRWQVEAAAPAIDYVVVAAPAPTAITALTAITGRQPVPPSWAAGALFDRLVKYPSDPAGQYEQEVQSDIDNIDRYHLHVDGYRIEGWQELPRAFLARVIGELKARGIHPLLYFRAFVGQDTTGTDDPAQYDYAISHHLVATHADGSPYTFISNFNAPAAVIDFTNPAAVSWWQQRIESALDLGADGFMQDFGEQVLADMHFDDGETGATMHNRLPILYDQATRQAIDAYEREHPDRRIFFFTRAGYSGTPGDAAYENANFPGDETTDWTRSSGLASLTTDMLNRAVGGAYGYSTDIGGYFDVGPYQPTSRELFLRWAEWAALSPLFRLHGSLSAGLHAPWTYDAQTVSTYEALTALHLRAAPLILKLWREADATGIPITRPLWLAYPGDPGAARQDQEWLLGPDVLVAPVVTEGATSRSVYFPSGCWRSPTTGITYQGPGPHTVSAPPDQLPYFFHCGTDPFATASGCPAARGRIGARKLGPVRLGERRRAIRRALPRLLARKRYLDVFCVGAGELRVLYPPPRLTRQSTRGRALVILTTSRHYALERIRPGERMRRIPRRLRAAHRLRLRSRTWYLLRRAHSTGLIEVRGGVVREVGIAAAGLTPSAPSTRRLLAGAA